MAEEPATITYSIAEPFEQALKMVRRVLIARGLKVSGQLDISSRIRQRLLIGTAPCVVLLVSPSAALGKALGSDSSAVGLAPLHVVISSRGMHSEVHLLRILSNEGGLLDRHAMAAVNQIQAQILEAIEKIGIRVTLTV
jgi:uncharacterized protein (DUF302 family)